MIKQKINLLNSQVCRQQKKFLVITICFFFFTFTTRSQILSKQDSINFKKDLEKLLTRYGLQTAGYQINVQSNNQRGGQTAFTITNNSYVTNNYGIIPRTLSDVDKQRLLHRIDTIIRSNKLPKNIKISICVSMGNDENIVYANEIARFLENNGYVVDHNLGVCMSSGEFRLFYYKEENKIFMDVGSTVVKARP